MMEQEREVEIGSCHRFNLGQPRRQSPWSTVRNHGRGRGSVRETQIMEG